MERAREDTAADPIFDISAAQVEAKNITKRNDG